MQASPNTPWFTGVALAVFSAAFVTVATIAFASELARINVALAVLLSVTVAAGLAPTLWRMRRRPIWRWIVYGAMVGIPAGWIGVLLG
ncbi:MAG: DUF2537 domain-containing protein [Rhodococcus sp.]|nr:DUF2537 domain-containing protein [Rhodococcus sp. (in: high G+C Gram-positive bacteria)]